MSSNAIKIHRGEDGVPHVMVQRALDASCVRSSDMDALGKAIKKGLIPVEVKHISSLGRRSLVRVVIDRRGEKKLLADAVTGSLYGLDGVCLGNPLYSVESTENVKRRATRRKPR